METDRESFINQLLQYTAMCVKIMQLQDKNTEKRTEPGKCSIKKHLKLHEKEHQISAISVKRNSYPLTLLCMFTFSFWNGSNSIPMQRGMEFTKIIIP